MDRDAEVVPSSPTISSPSSSDLDTESTGSFFHDRSTTLGTLMGVSLGQIAASRPAALLPPGGAAAEENGSGCASRRQRCRRVGRRPRKRWWKLCQGEDMAPSSLADFLQVERRLSGGGGSAAGGLSAAYFFYGGGGEAEHEVVGGGPLFDNGRVLPPPPNHHRGESASSLARLPVLLTGICSGGDG